MQRQDRKHRHSYSRCRAAGTIEAAWETASLFYTQKEHSGERGRQNQRGEQGCSVALGSTVQQCAAGRDFMCDLVARVLRCHNRDTDALTADPSRIRAS